MMGAGTHIAAALLAAAVAAWAGAARADDLPGTLAQNVEPAYTPPTPEPPSSATFTLRELDFSASVLLDRADLEAIANEYEGRELALRDLQEIVAKVNALYQAKGMMTARRGAPRDGRSRLACRAGGAAQGAHPQRRRHWRRGRRRGPRRHRTVDGQGAPHRRQEAEGLTTRNRSGGAIGWSFCAK